MMDVLVMLEDRPDSVAALAAVHSVPSPLTAESPQRRVVTMYGDSSPESLAHALAAAVDGHRGDVRADDSFSDRARGLLERSGPAIRQLAASLNQAEWPEGAQRALTVSLPSPSRPSSGVMGSDALLEALREFDGVTLDHEEF
jgi:hypothetical protein